MLLQYLFCQVLRSTIVLLLCLLNTKYIVAAYFLSDAIAKALQCGWTLDLLWVWFLTKYASFASNNSCCATEHQLFYRSDRLAGWAALGWPLYNNPATSLLFCYEYWPVSTAIHRNCLSSWPISHQTTTTYLRKCILQDLCQPIAAHGEDQVLRLRHGLHSCRFQTHSSFFPLKVELELSDLCRQIDDRSMDNMTLCYNNNTFEVGW